MERTSTQSTSKRSGETFSSRVNALSTPLAILAGIVSALWIIEVADWLLIKSGMLDKSLDQYFGIYPRSVDTIWHIASAPFLHADVNHLIANTIPLLVLGYLIIVRDRSHLVMAAIVSAFVSGLGIWLLGGAGTVHIGASGVVFGFMGYLLGRGFFERSLISILFGVVALLLYGGILIGVLPGQPGVSWLGHLFGLLGGILVAYGINLVKRRRKPAGNASSKPVENRSVKLID